MSILRQQHHDAWREPGLVYRPGQDLHESQVVVDPVGRPAPELDRLLRSWPGYFAEAFWRDGEVRLAGREYLCLLRSLSYQRGHGERQLDCASCHGMHGGGGPADAAWADDMLRPGARGNAACVGCHAELAAPAALAGYDFLADDADAQQSGAAVLARWRAGPRRTPRPAVLLGSDGLDAAGLQRLHAQRDDRPVRIAE